MSKHGMTKADELFYGSAINPGAYKTYERPGVPITPMYRAVLGAPVAADPDGYATAQAVTAAGDLTLDGVLAGAADVARGVTIKSTAAGDSAQTATIYGTDIHGNPVVEVLTFNGSSAVNGKKAFKTVSRIAISAALTGNASAGTTDVLGLPVAIEAKSRVIDVFFNDAKDASATLVVADSTAPATGTTGDVYGTVDPNAACNGSDVVVLIVPDPGSFGVAQFMG